MVAHFLCSFCTLVQSLITIYQHHFNLWKCVPVSRTKSESNFALRAENSSLGTANFCHGDSGWRLRLSAESYSYWKWQNWERLAPIFFRLVFLPVVVYWYLIFPYVNSNPNVACLIQRCTAGDCSSKATALWFHSFYFFKHFYLYFQHLRTAFYTLKTTTTKLIWL